MKETLNYFDSEAEALKYASDNIGKYDYEVVNIAGNTTILANSSTPQEFLINEPVQDVVEEIFKRLGIEDWDTIKTIGKEVSEQMQLSLYEHGGVKFLHN